MALIEIHLSKVNFPRTQGFFSLPIQINETIKKIILPNTNKANIIIYISVFLLGFDVLVRSKTYILSAFSNSPLFCSVREVENSVSSYDSSIY